MKSRMIFWCDLRFSDFAAREEHIADVQSFKPQCPVSIFQHWKNNQSKKGGQNTAAIAVQRTLLLHRKLLHGTYICQFSITFPMAVWIIQKFVNFVPGQSPFFSFVMSLRGKLPGRNHQSWESWTKILISRAFRGRVGCSTCSHGAV